LLVNLPKDLVPVLKVNCEYLKKKNTSRTGNKSIRHLKRKILFSGL
jgi:hypothetical protein